MVLFIFVWEVTRGLPEFSAPAQSTVRDCAIRQTGALETIA